LCRTAPRRPSRIDDIRIYQPSTCPGAPVPHVWIEDEGGNRRALKDLVGPGRFLLIVGEKGESWCAAAAQIGAETGLPLDALRIGHLDGDFYDPRCTWLRYRQVHDDGAVLVRPDRFIAWRAAQDATDPRRALLTALSQILGRPVVETYVA
jgi:2,4-dichlorophenol 6-monooxygenase